MIYVTVFNSFTWKLDQVFLIRGPEYRCLKNKSVTKSLSCTAAPSGARNNIIMFELEVEFPGVRFLTQNITITYKKIKFVMQSPLMELSAAELGL